MPPARASKKKLVRPRHASKPTRRGGKLATAEALRRSEERFRSLAELAPVGIFETDAAGRNTFVNAAGAEILGLPPARIRGKGWEKAIHPEDRERVTREWAEAVARGSVYTGEYRYLRRGGETVLARGYGTAVRNRRGEVTGFIGVVMDVTERRAVEQERALASRLTALGALVAGLSHEINNPLSAGVVGIALGLDLVKDLRKSILTSDLEQRHDLVRRLEDVLESLGDAQAGVKRIAQLVREMAVFGQPEPDRVRVDLRAAVDRAIQRLTVDPGTVRIEDRGAPDVLAAEGQLEQVAGNLLENAALARRSGARGRITVRLDTQPDGSAVLEIVDEGAGIDPKLHDRIFEPFFTTRPVGNPRGPGLGLALTHAIVTSLGGSLTFVSAVGRGSTFRVELPAADPHGDRSPARNRTRS